MRRVKLFIGSVVILLIGSSIFNACKKEDFLSKDSNTAVQKWNLDEDYPFVLPEAMIPYQYAINKDDLPWLFEYMQVVFKNYQAGTERGYFVLSLNTNMDRINYGFIYGTFAYNIDDFIYIDDPNIKIDEDEDDNIVCYGVRTRDKETTNKGKLDKWVDRKLNHGWLVCEGVYEAGTYWAHARK